MPLYVVIAKFGNISAFVALYTVQVEMFPTLFTSTSFGISSLISQIFIIFTPLIATKDEPLPMALFVSLTFIGIMSSLKIVRLK